MLSEMFGGKNKSMRIRLNGKVLKIIDERPDRKVLISKEITIKGRNIPKIDHFMKY